MDTQRNITTPASISGRDRAVLRAVASGRCEICASMGEALVVDGLCVSDQFVGPRLLAAGFIAEGPCPGQARLTALGASVLAAA
jgi:hypothetical protein